VALSRSRSVAAVLIAVLALGLGSAAVLARDTDARFSSSTLTVLGGVVVTSHGGADFTLGREGDVLAAGDTIRTGPGASAAITYIDGSSVRVEADAEIVVMSLRTSDSTALEALGRAWQVVTKLVHGSSRYEVRGPSSTASVRG
jgi:hypothetical protein